ncbi:MAG: 50S ribosomal protein L9 [Treponema sp.]|jgi:large subunit ribosomal protein L9|nr:50S ribosomal protein L9 [Treponema sp.]
MKVILNKDLAALGEEGDVKDVAKGYARNFLFPRGIALPYNERTIKLFESRKEEIEARKIQKRQDASGLKDKLEALSLALIMPAGTNGKLYGAVTAQTVADELAKQGFQIERKKIEIPGNTIKSVGKYKIAVKLYENAAAECSLSVEGQPVKAETKTPAAPPRRRRKTYSAVPSVDDMAEDVPASEGAAETPREPEAPAAANAGTSTDTASAE